MQANKTSVDERDSCIETQGFDQEYIPVDLWSTKLNRFLFDRKLNRTFLMIIGVWIEMHVLHISFPYSSNTYLKISILLLTDTS